MQNLHPGARWHFRILSYFSFGALGLFFAGFTPVIFYFDMRSILISIVLILLAMIVLAEIYVSLAYKNWLYEFTKDQLKIEKGVIWKTYSNIPYSRIQNVDIHRGIIARILGFSSVNIQTAGYSMATRYGAVSEGYIPAVSKEEGEKIRDSLMKKISKNK